MQSSNEYPHLITPDGFHCLCSRIQTWQRRYRNHSVAAGPDDWCWLHKMDRCLIPSPCVSVRRLSFMSINLYCSTALPYFSSEIGHSPIYLLFDRCRNGTDVWGSHKAFLWYSHSTSTPSSDLPLYFARLFMFNCTSDHTVSNRGGIWSGSMRAQHLEGAVVTSLEEPSHYGEAKREQSRIPFQYSH